MHVEVIGELTKKKKNNIYKFLYFGYIPKPKTVKLNMKGNL